MKRVSVVILNWNGVDMLRKFIPSVMDNSVGEGIEICVADNAYIKIFFHFFVYDTKVQKILLL